MASPQQNPEYVTEEEYLAFDLESAFKNEYANGQIYMMAGASRYHNLIANYLSTELTNQLRGEPCEVYQESMRVAINTENHYRYPDVVAVCEKPLFAPDTKPDTLINPVLLAEVLSDSTASVDRIQKVDEYLKMSSVQDYLILAQSEIRVLHFQRNANKWLYYVYLSHTDVIDLPAIGCTLSLDDIYRNISFESKTPATDANES